MKVFALTFGGSDSASTHYRLLQYRDHFLESGVEFSFAPTAEFSDYPSLAEYDTVILQKTLLSGRKLRLIRKYSKRLVYDADDRIWMRPGKPYSWLTQIRLAQRLKATANTADICLAANRVIAQDLEEAGAQTAVVPMALDGNTWNPGARSESPLRIGWAGAPKNLKSLELIRPAIARVLRRFSQATLVVYCGERPSLKGIDFDHVPWREGGEAEAIRQFHIGLLPLPNDPFAQGKSPIKSLQYFASGVATIASPVGATLEIVTPDRTGLLASSLGDWERQLIHLVEDASRRTEIGAAGRSEFESRFEAKAVYQQLLTHLR
jgi:glycosyltransferase involved in cell wall biosynthesis